MLLEVALGVGHRCCHREGGKFRGREFYIVIVCKLCYGWNEWFFSCERERGGGSLLGARSIKDGARSSG